MRRARGRSGKAVRRGVAVADRPIACPPTRLAQSLWARIKGGAAWLYDSGASVVSASKPVRLEPPFRARPRAARPVELAADPTELALARSCAPTTHPRTRSRGSNACLSSPRVFRLQVVTFGKNALWVSASVALLIAVPILVEVRAWPLSRVSESEAGSEEGREGVGRGRRKKEEDRGGGGGGWGARLGVDRSFALRGSQMQREAMLAVEKQALAEQSEQMMQQLRAVQESQMSLSGLLGGGGGGGGGSEGAKKA